MPLDFFAINSLQITIPKIHQPSNLNPASPYRKNGYIRNGTLNIEFKNKITVTSLGLSGSWFDSKINRAVLKNIPNRIYIIIAPNIIRKGCMGKAKN